MEQVILTPLTPEQQRMQDHAKELRRRTFEKNEAEGCGHSQCVYWHYTECAILLPSMCKGVIPTQTSCIFWRGHFDKSAVEGTYDE